MTQSRRSFLTSLAGAAAVPASVPLLRAATIPRKATDFPFVLDGRNVTLKSILGKPTVVEFALTTCSHCQQAAQHFDKIYREMSPRGLQVYALAINDDGPDAAAFKRMLNLSFPVGKVERDRVYPFLEIPMMQQRMLMPQVVLIDRAGMIVSQHAGDDYMFNEPGEEEKIRAAVEKILPAPAKPAAKKAPAKGTSKK